MSLRTVKDATKALQAQFSAAKSPLSLPSETRRMLQDFVTQWEGDIDAEESAAAHAELRHFWERYVGDNPQKLALFAGVLRELQPAVVETSTVWEWWLSVIKPVLGGSGYKRQALEDARTFVVTVMVAEEDEDAPDLARISKRMCDDLLKVYLARTQVPSEADPSSASENAQVAQQVEDVLVAFGRKKPTELFMAVDSLVVPAASRLQALSLLSSFLRHQTPHIYLITNTPLLEHLLQCLTNDTSTAGLSMALTSLNMLLPHIPGSLAPLLPRLFLIYSRLLCWERFSPLSTEADRNVVTDDRVANEVDEEGRDPGNVGLSPTWSILRPEQGVIEASTPELLTYFTYLYGMYPLNLTSYIRKARRYLKDANFPGADAFDLDSEVIRRRSEQYREVHLLHANFCNFTVEDELEDSKWATKDPAEVVGECHGLFINKSKPLASPGPPPTGKLPDIPLVPPLSAVSKRSAGPDSPALGSIRSASGRTDSIPSPTARTQDRRAAEDEHLRPSSKGSEVTPRTTPSIDEFAIAPEAASERDSKESLPQNNVAWLQREIQLLKSDLNFERWHKAQYSQHIGQITHRNVKNATIEAETLNLFNANKALKRQLEQVQKAREATIKDAALSRKQTNSLEAKLAERFNKLKAEQESWRFTTDKMTRLQSEVSETRELLVTAEAEKLSNSHELRLAKQDLEKLHETQGQLQETRRRLHEYQHREFEFEHNVREKQFLENEKELLQMKVQRYEDERERMTHVFSQRVAELEARLNHSNGREQRTSSQHSADSHALGESQSRLLQLRKAHARLLEKYTDLELEYQEARSQLESFQVKSTSRRTTALRLDDRSGRAGSGAGHARNPSDFGFEFVGDYNPAEAAYALPSASEPSNREYLPGFALPATPPGSEATVHSSAGLTFRPSPSRGDSLLSKSSGSVVHAFNPSAPLGSDEGSSVYSKPSQDGVPSSKKEKIAPDSQLRVYGRGGAQNIKLKQKESTKDKSDAGSTKKSVLRGLRGLG